MKQVNDQRDTSKLVSVIVPTYDRAHIILRALNSVAKQTYVHWELIVVDDASSDHTTALVHWFFKRHGLLEKSCLIKLAENRGVSHARNQALGWARGEWVCFLDSDDEWLPEKLERQIELSLKRPDLVAMHGEEIWIRGGVRVNPMRKHQKAGGHIFEKCLPMCVISPSAVMIKKKILLELGGMDENFPVCEDYDLWLKLTSLYEVGYIEQALIIKYGGHEDQLSRKMKAMDYFRVKALDRILKLRKQNLTPAQKRLVQTELIKKATILLAGYKKHQNMENFEEIQRLYHEHHLTLLTSTST